MTYSPEIDEGDVISELNVTPLVDVALVLLIIFMVTATYIVTKSIPIDLPEAATGEDVATTLVITITTEGDLYLDGERADETVLESSIRSIQDKRQDVRVVVAADNKVSHGRVVRIIDLVRQLGVSRFAINIDARKTASDEVP